MADLQTLTKPFTPTDDDIRTWVGDQSFSRGQSYYRQHAITNQRRQGDTLKAHCYGSAPQPYRVEVTLGRNQIISDRCFGPIGGHCKHVAALLLTWSKEPESFTVVEELAAGLDRLSKAELSALVTKMVDRHPDLEQLHRVEEVTDAQQSSNYDLLTMEEIFAEHEQEDLFGRLMLERARTSQDRRIHEWLKRWAEQGGDSTTALHYAETLFWQQPSTAGYRELKKLAQQSGRWAMLQPQVMAKLAAEPRFRTVNIQVHLEEGEVDQALVLLRAPQTPHWLGFDRSILLEVARAAAKTRPHAAIDIYLKYARWLIAQRNRTSYAAAAARLAAVKWAKKRAGASSSPICARNTAPCARCKMN